MTRDLIHVCPSCGQETFYQGGSGPDALPLLDAMQKQMKAAEHVDRGAGFILQGLYAEAEKELKLAIKINPLNATAHGNMGGIFLRQNKPKKAIPWLEKALKINPHLEGVPEALVRAKAFTGRR